MTLEGAYAMMLEAMRATHRAAREHEAAQHAYRDACAVYMEAWEERRASEPEDAQTAGRAEASVG